MSHPIQDLVSPPDDFVGFPMEFNRRSIGEVFECRAAEYADRLAVKDGPSSLTYAELNEQANRIARAVREQVPDGDRPVVVLVKKDPSGIAAVLGVVKAGVSVLLLDRSFPTRRIRSIVEDVNARLLVVNGEPGEWASQMADSGRRVLNVDDPLNCCSSANLDLQVKAEELKVLFFTSGSSGSPKGIVHNHRTLLDSLWWQYNSLKISPSDRISLLGTLGHIAFIIDLLRGLLNGASVFPYDIIEEGMDNLPSWLRKEEITVYHSVPSVFRHFAMRLHGDGGFPNLRLIHLGGETVTASDVDAYRRHFSDSCVLLNNLGSTEVPAMRQFFMNKNTHLKEGIVPVGYPVPDRQIVLLDDTGTAVAPDQVGEITVRSRHLALGYWNRPDLTREVFSSLPDGASCRTYRTGDLGRLDSSGCLYYLGRKDAQVKLRGIRIEPGEVENELLSHPAVTEAVVLAQEDAQGRNYLVAFATVDKNHTPSTPEGLNEFLRGRLPSGMQPRRVVLLDLLPRTTTGKIDRRAVGELDLQQQSQGSESDLAEMSPLEQELAALWQENLGFGPIGRHSDYFDLGGDSLHATDLTAKMSGKLGVPLPLNILVQAPTIEALTRYVRDAQSAPEISGLVVLQSGGAKPPLFVLPGAGGGIFIFRRLTPYLRDERSVYGLSLPDLNMSRRPWNSIETLASQALDSIISLQPDGPYFLCGFSSGGVIAWEIASQLQRMEKLVALVVLLDTMGLGVSPNLPFGKAGRIEQAYSTMFACRQKLRLHSEALQRLGLRGKVSYLNHNTRKRLWRMCRSLVNRPQALNGSPGVDFSRRMFDALRHYEPREYEGRIVLIRAAHQLSPVAYRDRTLGWGELATSGIEVYEVTGFHHSILLEPQVCTVGTILSKILKNYSAEQPAKL